MAGKKGNRVTVGLQCEETGMRIYVTSKNRIHTTEKLRLRKYNPKLRRHTVFVEVKKLK